MEENNGIRQVRTKYINYAERYKIKKFITMRQNNWIREDGTK